MKGAKWLTDKYICLMLLVFPLWTGFEGYADLTRSKFLFFAVLTGAWLLAAGVSLLRAHTPPPRLRPEGWVCLVFLAGACLSAACSPYGAAVLIGASRYDGLLTLLLYGCIFLGVSAFGERRALYAALLGVSCAACCAVALLQLAGGNPLGLFPGGYTYYDAGVRYSGAFLGTIGNTDLLAAYFCLCVPYLAACAALARKRRALWLLLPAALAVWVLARSGVASGALALLLGALAAVPLLAQRRFGRRRLTRALALSGAAALLCALAAVYFCPAGGTAGELSQVLHGHVEDSYGSSRVLIWRETLRLFRERPLTGGGPDTLTLRTSVGFRRYVAETGVTLSTHVDNAHNEFLNDLVNLGLAGTLPYLALCVLCLRRVRRGGGAEAGCALICYWIQSFFGLGLCIVVPMVWIMMGLVFAPAEETNWKEITSDGSWLPTS